MGEHSNISWTEATWNPTTGCSHVSPGCEHCYAEALSLRRGWSKKPWTKPNAAENVVLHPDRLDLPLRWKTPRRVFVDSMSDLFHEEIPDEFIAKVFAVMNACPSHIFQILTKRPERMASLMTSQVFEDLVDLECEDLGRRKGWVCLTELDLWPLSNVWLGVSVEDQRRADERIPLLLKTPAAVRFLSCEPLLDYVSLSWWLDVRLQTWRSEPSQGSLDGWRVKPNPVSGLAEWRPGLDWVIVGGESGHGYRPMDLDWPRSIRDQCAAAGVAFWYKQTGGPRPGTGEELDGQTWHQFPEAAR